MNVRRYAALFNHRALRDTTILNSQFSILNFQLLLPFSLWNNVPTGLPSTIS